MRTFLLIMSLPIAVFVQAEDVYRGVDEENNVFYTDIPESVEEKIHIKDVQTIKAPPIEPSEHSPGQKPQDDAYTKLEITSPEDGGSIYDNNGIIDISVFVKPALKARTGDKLILLMDGQQVAESIHNIFNLDGIDPGTHSFVVTIIDKDEKELKRSIAVSFTSYHLY